MKKRIKACIFYTLACALLISSCKKNTPPDDIPDISAGKGVFIVNEGNFQWSNASVSYYNFDDGSFSEDIFKQANNRPLGDVAQSMYVFNGKGYIVVNNSNKIEIVNIVDFTSAGVITGLNSPRYFLPINTSKAYVSELYSKCIHIIDLNSNTKTASIPCTGSSEEMIFADEQVVVTNTRTNYIYLINSNNDIITDSIMVGFASNSLAKDKNGKLWVMCAGDEINSIKASLHCVNLQTKEVEKNFDLNVSLNIWDKMRMNNTKDTIYYMCNGVYKMSIDASTLPASPFISQGNCLFLGIAVNPNNNNIAVADAVDYIQKGKVYYYSSNGSLLTTINSGVIPVDFYFN
ncbi:MAG: hypothetical protein PHR81_06140 [Bacteroidales bacterium]|jgi:hypothetical protein|nr:hypothetical protein [Bacteroidales bacterium]MDD4214374.1 hypothetical protein [Bacteroidales bacterium]